MNSNLVNINTARLWDLCKKGSKNIYYSLPPQDSYANAVACLMLGTASQESNMQWERQRTPNYTSDVGGFSKWQVEKACIQDCLEYCKRNRDFADRATQWIFHDPHLVTNDWIYWPISTILWALRMDDNDKLGFLFARFKYLHDPLRIPADIQGQAQMWKRVFNTYLGAGTVEQYLTNWDKFCASVTGIPSTGVVYV